MMIYSNLFRFLIPLSFIKTITYDEHPFLKRFKQGQSSYVMALEIIKSVSAYKYSNFFVVNHEKTATVFSNFQESHQKQHEGY